MKMGKRGITILLVALTASMGAYAKEKPYQYNDKMSKALNLWRAADMGDGITDQKVASDKIGDFLDTTTGKAVDTAVNISILESGGIGSGAATGLGLLTFALNSLAPDEPPLRNSMWAWVKDTGQTAEEAQEQFTKKLLISLRKAIVGMDYKSNVDNGNSMNEEYLAFNKGKKGFSMAMAHVIFEDQSGDCKEIQERDLIRSNCRIFITTYLPKKRKFFWNGEEGSYWFFSADDDVYFNKIEFSNISIATNKRTEVFRFNEFKILESISKEMGDGFYIYVAPNTTFVTQDKKIGFPVIFEKGDKFLFLKEK